MQPHGTPSMDDELRGGSVPIVSYDSLVLVPGMCVPLCVSRPSDQLAIAAAMAGDRLLGVAVRMPNDDGIAVDEELIHPVVCLGRIEWDAGIPNDRALVVVRGLLRGRTSEWTIGRSGCRRARLDVRHDRYCAEPVIDRQRRQLELLELYSEISQDAASTDVVDPELPLGRLCDLITASVASRRTLDKTLQVFAEIDADQRSDLLLNLLRSIVRDCRETPQTAHVCSLN